MPQCTRRIFVVGMGMLLATMMALVPAAQAQKIPKPDGNLDQCRNGSMGSPIANCSDLPGPLGWVNGNAGSSNAHNREGGTIAYRIVLSDLVEGHAYVLEMGYDIKHSGKHALDYLTTANRPAPWGPAPVVDACDGAGVSETTCAITDIGGGILSFSPNLDLTDLPPLVNNGVDCRTPTSLSYSGSDNDGALQPCTSQANLPAAEKQMGSVDALNVRIDPIISGDLGVAQSESTIRIGFVANATTALFTWGGHIGWQVDWGYILDVPQTAAGISGSPYHMRFHGLCEIPGGLPASNVFLPSCADGGNQDRSLSAAAIIAPASINIIKACDPTSPASDPDFTFNVTPQPGTALPNSFMLKCGDNRLTDPITDFGDYTITEASTTGWALTDLICTGGGTDVIVDKDNATVTIGLDQSEVVTCTFTNTQQAQLHIIKKTLPDADPQLFTFTPTNWGSGTFELKDNDSPEDSGYLVPGMTDYETVETEATGYKLTDRACVLTGTMTAKSFTEITDGIRVNLAAGEDVTCTFTNTKQAQLHIIKETIPNGDTQLFTFTPTHWGSGTFQLKDNDSPEDSGYLVPDSTDYDTAETPEDGYMLTGRDCVLTGTATTKSFTKIENGIRVNLNIGEEVTCTFTNTKQGRIIIRKLTYGGNETFSFAGTNPAEGSGLATSFDLTTAGWTPNAFPTPDVPGNSDADTATDPYDGDYEVVPMDGYEVTESTPLPVGWALQSISCSDESDMENPSTHDLATKKATINVAPGETVTCTFTNTVASMPFNKLVNSSTVDTCENPEVGTPNLPYTQQTCTVDGKPIPQFEFKLYNQVPPDPSCASDGTNRNGCPGTVFGNPALPSLWLPNSDSPDAVLPGITAVPLTICEIMEPNGWQLPLGTGNVSVTVTPYDGEPAPYNPQPTVYDPPGNGRRCFNIYIPAGTETFAITVNNVQAMMSMFKKATITINYTFDVMNTGSFAITGPITVEDDKLGTVSCTLNNEETGMGTSLTDLDPMETATCTKTSSPTEKMDSVTNTAHAEGTGGAVKSNDDSVTVDWTITEHDPAPPAP